MIFSRPMYHYLAIGYIAIAVIRRCHLVLSLVIQSLRLSLSPRLFVIIILLRLVSLHSWRFPTGLGAVNNIHFVLLILMDWCGSSSFLVSPVLVRW